MVTAGDVIQGDLATKCLPAAGPGVRLNVLDEGTGQAIVFLHTHPPRC